MKLATININFDSLNEAYGFPANYRDPCFFEVAERFFKISDYYDFKYSIYIVGKDLEDGRYREAVKEWAIRGHEIGNHSFHHHMNLGALKPDELKAEVERSHELIAKTTGVPPRGFISPAWSTSEALLEALCDLGYEYDTSLFPSWLLTPMVWRIAWGYRGSHKARRIVTRKDYHLSILGHRKPYIYKSRNGNKELAVMPLPTTTYRVACWHTIGYMFGWKAHSKILRNCLRCVDYFYYLTHPGDLSAPEDQDERFSTGIPRLALPLEEKIRRFEEAVKLICSQRKMVTLSQMVETFVENPG
jgi:hypothetical protein